VWGWCAAGPTAWCAAQRAHACLAKAGSHAVRQGEASHHSCDYEVAWPKAGVRTCAVQVCACVYMWLLARALVVKGQREAREKGRVVEFTFELAVQD
jgi:hypothetical protein